jgi:hypothetical protein
VIARKKNKSVAGLQVLQREGTTFQRDLQMAQVDLLHNVKKPYTPQSLAEYQNYKDMR